MIDHGGGILREPRLARRLHPPFLVGGTALQHRFPARPFPGQAEAHQRLRAFLSGKRRVGPGRTAVGGDFDAADAPRAAPGDAGDLVEPGARQFHGGRGLGDHRLHAHLESELQRAPVGLQVRVLGSFVLGVGGLFGGLDPTQPLHVHVAFKAGEQQPHRVTLLGAQALTVLVQRDHRIVERLLYGDAAAHMRRIGAFGENPLRLR